MNRRRTGPVGLLVPFLLVATPGGIHAQWEAGIGIGVADTDQNAVALVGTLAWNLPVPPPYHVAIRGFADGELAVPGFKAGLGYEEPEREWIIDTATGLPQRPEGNTLWQARGWDLHAAAYTTVGWWRIHAGPGIAYNGLDGTTGIAGVVVVYVTARTELDVEFLSNTGSGDPRWRLRLSLGFWRFP